MVDRNDVGRICSGGQISEFHHGLGNWSPRGNIDGKYAGIFHPTWCSHRHHQRRGYHRPFHHVLLGHGGTIYENDSSINANLAAGGHSYFYTVKFYSQTL